jgi:hypothetical protein
MFMFRIISNVEGVTFCKVYHPFYSEFAFHIQLFSLLHCPCIALFVRVHAHIPVEQVLHFISINMCASKLKSSHKPYSTRGFKIPCPQMIEFK